MELRLSSRYLYPVSPTSTTQLRLLAMLIVNDGHGRIKCKSPNSCQR
jgi:hypothetical protein